MSQFLTYPRCILLCVTAAVLPNGQAAGADVIAAPGEAGLRAAIAAAQEGDTVILSNHVEFVSTVEIDKRLTLRSGSGEPHSIVIRGDFAGELFHLQAAGIVFEGLNLGGSPQTDGLRVEQDVFLRDCYLQWFRAPVLSDYSPGVTVRLERTTVAFNEEGLEVTVLEARDSVFSFNAKGFAGGGVNVQNAFLERCRFENNYGFGLVLAYGTVKNCTFRFNAGFGLWCDADPGDLILSGSLFYANAEGGLMVGEQVVATIDNCTFTRHTASAAIYVSQATSALFRHCTVADNAFFEAEPRPQQRPGNGAFTIESGQVTLQNCIVADNPTNGSPHAASLAGSWIDGGGNIIGGPAQLSLLAGSGAPTLSMLPLPGSPAIDAGVPSDLFVDARGFWRVAGGAPDAGAVETDAEPLVDTDGDGIPDLWELLHGLNKDDPADAFSDADHDGQHALAEYRSRTNPNDAQSAFRFTEARVSPPAVLPGYPRVAFFLWSYVPGVTYELQTSSDLRQWRKVNSMFHAYSTLDERPALLYEVQVQPTTAFYRVRLKESAFE